MKVAILKETAAQETRVATTPSIVKKMTDMGLKVSIEKGAGLSADMTDTAYKEAGATITSASDALKDADIILSVHDSLKGHKVKPGSVYISQLDARTNEKRLAELAKEKVTAFALDLLPRTSRAQSMDVLSSQSNLAGYKAVIDGAAKLKQIMPMMMTAAGTLSPVRVLVLGAGVAGLQAIATAKRLGAIVYATDVRPEVKEQVESLGGKFLNVEKEQKEETPSVYAKTLSKEDQKKQAKAVHEQLKKTDLAICTALIPGRPAPKLITKEMLKDMPQGAIVVDLATSAGGNCEGSEFGKTTIVEDVTILGPANAAGDLSADASQLYAKNILNFLTLLYDKSEKSVKIDFKDDIIEATCVTHQGEKRLKG